MREMKSMGAAVAWAAFVAWGVSAVGAAAQDDAEADEEAPAAAEATEGGVSTNRVAERTAWSVFVETDPALECWGVSGPSETVNTRDGNRVAVRRGDILLFVAYRPTADVAGEVSFTGGYPFDDNSTVTMEIGSDRFEMFTRGEFAWPVSSEDDARIVAAMKRGAEVTLTGRSARGTQTEDTFSLMGFTAALEEVEARCTS